MARSPPAHRLTVTPEPALLVTWKVQEYPADAPPLTALVPRERLARLGLDPQARLLAIEGAPPRPDGRPSARARRTRPPWLVYLHDGSRRYFAVVAP